MHTADSEKTLSRISSLLQTWCWTAGHLGHGRVLISLYFLAHSLSDSENGLGSTETSSTDSTEDPGPTHLTDFMGTSFPPLQIAAAPQVNNSLPADQDMLDQGIKTMARNYISKKNDSSLSKVLVTMLQNETLSFGIIMNTLQNLETGTKN